jgi:hypothetical protein
MLAKQSFSAGKGWFSSLLKSIRSGCSFVLVHVNGEFFSLQGEEREDGDLQQNGGVREETRKGDCHQPGEGQDHGSGQLTFSL